jgi:hypothetical protein
MLNLAGRRDGHGCCLDAVMDELLAQGCHGKSLHTEEHALGL